jgi:tRNA U54 and U55 pseudouridine synthase Pus10
MIIIDQKALEMSVNQRNIFLRMNYEKKKRKTSHADLFTKLVVSRKIIFKKQGKIIKYCTIIL